MSERIVCCCCGREPAYVLGRPFVIGWVHGLAGWVCPACWRRGASSTDCLSAKGA